MPLRPLRLKSMPSKSSSSKRRVKRSQDSFAAAFRYLTHLANKAQLFATLRRALASAFLLFMTCFWSAFLFMLLFVVCFIVCRFCCAPPTICSVNSEVVSKFDAAKVIRFLLIKSSSFVYNGSSQFGTIPLFFHGVQIG